MKGNIYVNNKIYVLMLLIVVSFMSPFFGRIWPFFDKAAIGISFLLTFLILISGREGRLINRAFLAVMCFSFVFYSLLGLGAIYILEFLIWLSFMGFLFIEKSLLVKHCKNLLYLIIFFSSIQLIFDILFPVLHAIDVLDRYTGTFIMPNNKSRYLIYIFVFLITTRFEFYKPLKIVCIISIAISLVLGNSLFGILFMGISLISAKFIRKIYIFFILVVLGVFFSFQYINNNYAKNESLLINYNRYLDKDHGVLAVYEYGINQLKKNYYLGVGFGNFSSRAGQFLGSPVTRGIPETMILYNQDLFNSKAPYGLSAFFVLVVEMGIAAVPIILFAINRLWRYKDESLWGYFSFYYLFFIINYNPTFFEFSEGSLYILTFLLTNLYLRRRRYFRAMLHPYRS